MNMKKNILIAVLIAVIAILGFIVWKDNKPHLQPIVQNTPIQNQSPVENQTQTVTPSQPVKTQSPIQENFFATSTDPYTPGEDTILGGPIYELVESPIGSDNIMHAFAIYTDGSTGKPYTRNGKIYYNPTEIDIPVKFGSQAAVENKSDFIAEANATIEQNGYVIVADFESFGPPGVYYTVYHQ